MPITPLQQSIDENVHCCGSSIFGAMKGLLDVKSLYETPMTRNDADKCVTVLIFGMVDYIIILMVQNGK